MLKRKTNTKFATGKEEPVGMLIGLLPIGKLGGADLQSPDHVHTMAWGPIVLPSSSWIETKAFLDHGKQGTQLPSGERRDAIQACYPVPHFVKFFLQKQTNNLSSISLMLLHSFTNFGRTRIIWSIPTSLLPPGIWTAAVKTKRLWPPSPMQKRRLATVTIAAYSQ